MVMSLAEQKKKMRTEVKQYRRELPAEYCRQSDSAIFSLVTGLNAFKQADVIFCFVGTVEEVDTMPVIQEAWRLGKRVGVPLCVHKGIMEVREIFERADLQVGSYDILEPKQGLPVISPEEIELAIVPCLSCSHDGKRLGYGGGYYDRYLVRVRAPKAVVCREQLMRNDIPVDEYDLRMNLVISEDGVWRCEQTEEMEEH